MEGEIKQDGEQNHLGALDGMVVVDLSEGLAGAYCVKLLVDAGATGIRVEPAAGCAIRSRTPGSALFGYLDAGKQSVLADDTSAAVAAVAAADVLVVDGPDTRAVESRADDAIVVALSPFGLEGPWRDRPVSEFTLQALSGSIGGRGEFDHSPLAAGGELSSWISGVAASVAVLMAWRSRTSTLIDLAELETAVTIYNGFQTVAFELSGEPSPRPARVSEVPSIERAGDGWVGFCALSASQFAAFAEMIGRPEWAADPDIARIDWRSRNAAALRPAIEAWTTTRTVDQIVAEASARRLPCAPVGDGGTLPHIAQLDDRACFERDAGGSLLQPRPAARLSRMPRPARGAVPALGEHDLFSTLSTARARRHPDPPRTSDVTLAAPLDGIRVFDMTSFWAGPAASQILAAFGADVIKVESAQRPDGTRLATSYGVGGDRPWERAPLFLACNSAKRGITLDLTRPRGRDLARRVLSGCDVLIENYTPRVLERFGLLGDVDRDDLIVVRMPAWGLDGPWRDLPGFAQTMEQVTGLGWVTGRVDGPPLVPRGPCDPNGAYHAAFAVMLAILDRDRSGQGQLVESALVDAALAVAAEQVVEHSASGVRIDRIGNRSRHHAPQGVYAASADEEWVAISVTDDEQWTALAGGIGSPGLAVDPRLATVQGRHDNADEIDAVISAWCRSRDADQAADALRSVGVPAERVRAPREVGTIEQLRHRGFFESVDHPVAGSVRLPRFPATMRGRPGPFHRSPAPTLGQHGRAVLAELAGVTPDEYEDLLADAIVGEVPL